MGMIMLIDNYDSFTWNLWHFISDLGVEVETCRNDEKTVAEIIAAAPQAIVISPGRAPRMKPEFASIWLRKRQEKSPSWGSVSVISRSASPSALR